MNYVKTLFGRIIGQALEWNVNRQDDLKNCPFCGGKNAEVLITLKQLEPKKVYRIICRFPGCRVDGPIRTTEEMAREAWNKRIDKP